MAGSHAAHDSGAGKVGKTPGTIEGARGPKLFELFLAQPEVHETVSWFEYWHGILGFSDLLESFSGN